MADLIRALHTLSPTDEVTQRAIAQSLGLSWAEAAAGESIARRRPASRPSEEDQPPTDPLPSPAMQPAAHRRKAADSELVRVEGPPVAAPDWLRTATLLEEQAGPQPPAAVAPTSLFEPAWTRYILSTALATPRAEGRLEAAPIVKAIARARPLSELPRRSRPTLSCGVQLLIDRGEALEPFFGDQESLQEAIVKVAGRDRTRVLAFAGCPLWGVGRGLREEWDGYSAPARGTPVLALTDLGIGRPPLYADRAGVRDWLEFATLLKRAGCPLLALVPYATARWPAPLRRAMTILQWDRATSVAAVKRVVGGGLRVAGESRT